ncbi:Gfo/Idh/MocA family oxidoreductase [Sabulilitoribacter arenilitoris]|uniref:Gfo/Idh/MocA family oxidoreductase n=1 Tax=Wocania arenilitoris TaxID=2044858 RepID=A0AAE3JLM6_9FLAO|nr:Gfo/Idh/MocA family oxidoreductase [Wocania arenilitoris]MCF7566916.1 Gfo/Idh/MocA family oxidoreductase [Wocania arenilitoris]
MNNTIKTGVLSFGMSGSLFHCPFLEVHSGFDLFAIVERTKKKAHLTYPNVISYNSVEELLKDTNIELVVVNTPSATHFDLALKAIQANKHVLVEKPFTVNFLEAKTLFKEAKKRNVFVMPFQNRRFDSDFLSVKHVVESKKLGDLIEVHFRYDRYSYKINTNASKENPVPGNGVMYNLGSHLLDAAIALFGMPLEWKNVKLGLRPNTQIDDYALVHLKYPKGLQVFITANLLVADAQPSFVLHGVKGSYVKERTDVQEDQLKAGIKPDNQIFGIEKANKEGLLTTIENNIKKQEKIASKKSSYLNIFEAVYQTVRNHKPFVVTESDIIKQVEILES